eukprot:350905-Chlamydomonas_euryale.AAC.13
MSSMSWQLCYHSTRDGRSEWPKTALSLRRRRRNALTAVEEHVQTSDHSFWLGRVWPASPRSWQDKGPGQTWSGPVPLPANIVHSCYLQLSAAAFIAAEAPGEGAAADEAGMVDTVALQGACACAQACA